MTFALDHISRVFSWKHQELGSDLEVDTDPILKVTLWKNSKINIIDPYADLWPWPHFVTTWFSYNSSKTIKVEKEIVHCYDFDLDPILKVILRTCKSETPIVIFIVKYWNISWESILVDGFEGEEFEHFWHH